MYKKIILTIITSFIVIITGGTRFQNLESDNSVESENVVKELIKEEKENYEKNDIQIEEVCDSNKEIKQEEIVKEDEKKQLENKKGDNKDKTIGNQVIVNKEPKKDSEEVTKDAKKEEIPKKDLKEIKQPEQDKKASQEVQKKEEISKSEEPIYNAKETEKMRNAIDKYAKQNMDLIGENGEKLYKIRVSKDATEYNYFSPYRENQIEAKVANVYSCTFVIYALSMPNGSIRYYIGIE